MDTTFSAIIKTLDWALNVNRQLPITLCVEVCRPVCTQRNGKDLYSPLGRSNKQTENCTFGALNLYHSQLLICLRHRQL